MGAVREPSCVLMVSSAAKAVTYLSELLEKGRYHPISVAKSGSEARRMLMTGAYDLVIINAPLTDETGYDLAVYFAENSVSGVLLLVKNERFDEICYQVEEYGVLTIAKPMSRQLFEQALHLVAATREKLRTLEKENGKLQVKIQEIRLIDRAKIALVEYLQMSEAQAHRYIEKQAMDLRLPKRVVAENILKTYEN